MESILTRGWKPASREAERLGVTLVFEVIDRFESDWLNTVDEGLALLQEYPGRNF